VVAARRRRNTLQELIDTTPADGMLMGLASVNGDLFAEDRARCAVMSYDYTVLAGTQGGNNHWKLDRMAELAERWRCRWCSSPRAAAGGRATPRAAASPAASSSGAALGAVPLVGVNSGRCFAGNAAILGCCDVIIATKDSALGMGGPAMVEGGGLGVFRPEEIGPIKVMQANGTIDVLVEDEEEAVFTAKKYLCYFQGPLADWSCADQRLLRRAIPENRLRVYDIRKVIELIADKDTVLELRPEVRPGDGDRLHPHRGPPGRRVRQQPDAPGRGDRLRRVRQGRAVPAAVRGLRHPGAQPLGHARATWSGPRRRRPASSATARGCS
jgi:acetyl-CoA carboxylase carboxyltransferase component